MYFYKVNQIVKKEMEKEMLEAEANKKSTEKQSVLPSLLQGNPEEKSGSLECGVAGLFRCMCCTNPQNHHDDLQLAKIATALEKMERKLENL